MNKFFAFFFFVFGCGILLAHEDKINRTVILCVDENHFSRDYIEKLFPNETIRITSTNLFLYSVEFKRAIPFPYLDELKSKGAIKEYAQNRILKTRITTPNDTLFSMQTHHLNTIPTGKNIPYGIRSVNAWDNRKNITTLAGDTIVIAIIDEGFDLSHIDLDYFINYKENPNDTFDNDSNGARNDYLGWNADRNNEEINSNSSTHGMSVAGIAAAKGNNITGVAGVAWNAKILPINGIIDGGIDAAIRAYDYCINMKKLYTTSMKQKGAYIVAINFSIGTEGSSPADEPLWCAVYDKLEDVGILSTCAATNTSGDVLTIGDMPTLCNRPNMLTSTAMNSSTFGVNGNGYSSKYVHLVTPTNIYTTRPGNAFGLSGSGTSFTSPQVAGAIALMYSNFSIEFLDSLKLNPKKASLKIKNTILNNVDTIAALNGYVLSKGKLNLFTSIELAKKLQDSLKPRLSMALVGSNDNVSIFFENKNIHVVKSNAIPLFYSLYDMMGQKIMQNRIYDRESIIDCHHLPSGIYIMNCYDEGRYYSTKIDLR